ncbi:MAG: metal ABC transporter substrate-binding protein [Acidimicrobiales bacterium]
MRIVLVAAGLALVAGCGNPDRGGAGDRPSVVVTTNIVGDVVRSLVGDDAAVEVLMPPSADPHDFAPSAQQAAAMREADVLVVNGLGFEEGLLDAIGSATDDGVAVVTATDAIEPLDDDPHLFTDPARMRDAAELIADELVAQIPELDTDAFQSRVDAYLAELDALDAEVEELLAGIPAERRVLVTNHEVFGYFADRYDFEVLGAVIPGGSTLAEPSAADLADLLTSIDEREVPAIFADTSSPARLADALAAEGSDVDVVELFSESLGEEGSGGDTYLDMVRTNAERIAAALG